LEIDKNPPWLNKIEVPTQVLEKAQEFNVNLSVNQWNNLSDLEKFALIKLSRKGHENSNFLPALTEFHLVD